MVRLIDIVFFQRIEFAVSISLFELTTKLREVIIIKVKRVNKVDTLIVKIDFHMIAKQNVLRSFAIIWKHASAIVCDQLRSCDHMQTKVLRSAIETYPIIFGIPTNDSTLFSNKAGIFVCSNCLFVVNMAGVEQGNVSNEEFMEEGARYECGNHGNSRYFKDKNENANSGEKIGEKYNLLAVYLVCCNFPARTTRV